MFLCSNNILGQLRVRNQGTVSIGLAFSCIHICNGICNDTVAIIYV